jgi:hypothetical protein
MVTRQIENKVNWSAAIWSGLAGGMAFLVLEMFMVPLFLGGSPWAPAHGISAIVLGKGVLPPSPPTFAWNVFLAAMVIHLALSAIFGLIVVWIVHRWEMGTAVLVGAVLGLLLYFVNFYVMTGVFPWFAMSRGWVPIFTHIVFGAVTALVYKSQDRQEVRTVS